MFDDGDVCQGMLGVWYGVDGCCSEYIVCMIDDEVCMLLIDVYVCVVVMFGEWCDVFECIV